MATTGLLRRLLRAAYYSEVLMAVSAVLFVYICTTWMGRLLEVRWYVAAFTGCWWVYLLDSGLMGVPAEDEVNVPRRAAYIRRWRRSLLVAVVAMTIVTGIWLAVNPPRALTLGLLTLLALIGGAYTFAMVPGPGRRWRLKELATVKPAVISIAWLAGGMGLGLLEGVIVAQPSVPLVWIAAVLLVVLLADSLALDWLDRTGDRQHDIRTLAGRLSASGFAMVMVGCVALAVALWIVGGVASPVADARWWLAGAVLLVVHAVGLLGVNLRSRSPVAAGLSIAAWRFAGAAGLMLL